MSFTNIAFTAASLPFFFLYVCGCLIVSPQPVIPLQGAKHNSCVLLRKTNPAPDSQLWYKSNLTPSEILHLQMHPSKERKNESQQSNIKISTLKWKLEASDADSSNNTKNSTVKGKLVWRTKRLWNIHISWLGYILKCNTNVGFIPLEGCLHYLVFTPPRFLYYRFCTISFPTYSFSSWHCNVPPIPQISHRLLSMIHTYFWALRLCCWSAVYCIYKILFYSPTFSAATEG